MVFLAEETAKIKSQEGPEHVGKTLRTKMLYQDKDWLYQKYVKEKLSTVEIAKAYRDEQDKWCDPNTISRWLKKHNIAMRTLAEAQQNRHSVPTTTKRVRST